jgi:hypothetical protein
MTPHVSGETVAIRRREPSAGNVNSVPRIPKDAERAGVPLSFHPIRGQFNRSLIEPQAK